MPRQGSRSYPRSSTQKRSVGPFVTLLAWDRDARGLVHDMARGKSARMDGWTLQDEAACDMRLLDRINLPTL